MAQIYRFSPNLSFQAEQTLSDAKAYGYDFVITSQINTFNRLQHMRQQAAENPFRFKAISILTAGAMIALLAGGALGAYFAATTITTAGGANVAAALGISIAAFVVADIAGAYFNYTWEGHEIGDDTNAVFYLFFLGIGVPLWRAFGNNLDQDTQNAYNALKGYHTNSSLERLMETLNSCPQSEEIVKAKEELKAIYDFFAEGTTTDTELDSSVKDA